MYAAYTLRVNRTANLSRPTLSKLWIIQVISSIIIIMNLPIGIFIANYLTIVVKTRTWVLIVFPFVVGISMMVILFLI